MFFSEACLLMNLVGQKCSHPCVVKDRKNSLHKAIPVIEKGSEKEIVTSTKYKNQSYRRNSPKISHRKLCVSYLWFVVILILLIFLFIFLYLVAILLLSFSIIRLYCLIDIWNFVLSTKQETIGLKVCNFWSVCHPKIDVDPSCLKVTFALYSFLATTRKII